MTEPVDPLGAVAADAIDVEAKAKRGNLFKTLIGVVWMYSGRGLGLLWTFVLIFKLGIGDYGLYGMGLALGVILGPTLNNPWAVRAIRESEEDFLRERASRYILGVTMMAAGAALIPFTFVGFFGLMQAGGEITFNTYISRDARDGHPDRVYKAGAWRQFASTGLASIYLFVIDNPTLLLACLLYCVPYLVIAVPLGLAVRGQRPALPGNLRLMAILMGEMLFGTTLYLQGDVLLLGWLTDSTTVGYLNIGYQICGVLCAVGQSFVMPYYEPLRESGGDLAKGPKLRVTLALGAGVGILVLLTGIGFLLSPAPAVIGQCMLVLSIFGLARTIIVVFQTILFTQHRDRLRFLAGVALIPLKFALLVLLIWLGLGAVGAAIATATADVALLAVFVFALYRKPKVAEL